MQKSKILLSATLVLLLSLSFALPSFAALPPIGYTTSTYDFPRLDDLYLTLKYPRTTTLTAAQAGDIDNWVGMTVVSDINAMAGSPYYWNVSSNPGYHMCYIGVNCRTLTPDTSNLKVNYHNRVPGIPLYPLTIVTFREALELIVAPYKSTWLPAIYGFIVIRLDQSIPPANAYWYDPCIPNYPSTYPGAWIQAETILLAAGFQWKDNLGNPKAPGSAHLTTDKWLNPDGSVLWDGNRPYPKSDRYAGTNSALDLTPAYGFWVLCPGPAVATTSYQISMNHAGKWNLFFCGVDACLLPTDPARLLFMDDGQSVSSVITYAAFYNRNHDVYMLCWGLARNPDYLYDFFNPEVDLYGASNSPGLDHPGLNRATKTIKTWIYEDWELLASNVRPPCPPTVVVPASTTYGPFLTTAMDPFQLVVERVGYGIGAEDQVLTAGPDYSYIWTGTGCGYYLTIHIEAPITLNLGDSLEVVFSPGTHTRVFADKTEMQTICYLAQWKLYYLCPYLPIYSRNYINMYRTKPSGPDPATHTDWIEGWVEATGYGSEPTGADMPWSFNDEHWRSAPIGGRMNYHDAGQVFTLNPIGVSWVYEVTATSRIFEAMTAVDPYTQNDIPWLAASWEIATYNNDTIVDPHDPSSVGITNGMTIEFDLCNDITWQDGTKVNASDVAWNFEFLESITPAEFQETWAYLWKYEIVSEYQIKLYCNCSGLWYFYMFDGNALIFPKKAWQAYMGDYNPDTDADYTAAYNRLIWQEAYPSPPADKVDDAGTTPYDGLSMLYGTGPYYFGYWDALQGGQGTIRMRKNTTYWARVRINNVMSLTSLVGLQIHVVREQEVSDYDWEQTSLGLVYSPNIEISYLIVLINVNTRNPIGPITVDIGTKDGGHYGPINVGTLNPFAVRTYDIHLTSKSDVLAFPYGPCKLPRTGDLGSGTPPKWFYYDDAITAKDTALYLIALKNTPVPPQIYQLYVNSKIVDQK